MKIINLDSKRHVVLETRQWIRDTKFWMDIDVKQPGYKLMIVRYEDLHNNSEQLVRKMLHFLEWKNIDEYRIQLYYERY